MSNVLMAVPILLVTAGVAAPVLMLDARGDYISFLYRNPPLVTATVGAWGILFYWVTRRAAALILLRNSGAKLRVGDDPMA
jgi:hypothetical protein